MEEKHPISTVRLLAQRLGEMKIGIYAASACYFLTLSVFPVLLLVLASLRYTSLSADDLIHFVSLVIPQVLRAPAEKLIVNTYYASSGTVVSVSAVAAVWSASRGLYGLLTGLNHIYGVHEDRGYVYTRLISVFYTFVLLIVVLLTLVLQVFGESLLAWLLSFEMPMFEWLSSVIDFRFILLLLLQTTVFTLMYMELPNRRNGLIESLPGAVVAAVGWQTFSNLFSLYVLHVHQYTNIYGSVYLAALGMLWLYGCIAIMLFGGGLNQLILQWRKK